MFGPTFRSLIHSEFIFVYAVRECSFFLNLFILFIYFWLHWVFVAARTLS